MTTTERLPMTTTSRRRRRHSLATFKKHSAIFMRNIYFWSILYVMANSMCYSQFLVRFLFGCFLNQQHSSTAHSICLHVCKTAVCCLSVNVVSGSFMALKKRQKAKNKEETKKKTKKKQSKNAESNAETNRQNTDKHQQRRNIIECAAAS